MPCLTSRGGGRTRGDRAGEPARLWRARGGGPGAGVRRDRCEPDTTPRPASPSRSSRGGRRPNVRPGGAVWTSLRPQVVGQGKGSVILASMGPVLGSVSTAQSEPALLRQVLAQRLVHTVLQPIVDLDSGLVVAYEALSRGPAGPLETPDRLFAAARRSGHLAQLDELCRRTALHVAVSAGIAAPLSLFVNVEPEELDVAPLDELLELARGKPGDFEDDPMDPVIGEWDVVVLAPHFAAALLARDLSDGDVPDLERTFEFALTYDRDVVMAAAHSLMSRIAAQSPAGPVAGAAGLPSQPSPR